MKAIPVKVADIGYVACELSEATHLKIKIPGPSGEITLPVITHGSRRDHRGICWTWNGDINKPTLNPSVLFEFNVKNRNFRCHTFITEGKVQFLEDCSHSLAGRTMELLDV